MAIAPGAWSSTQQIIRFVEFQKSVGDLTGHPLAGYVDHGDRLPKLAPIGQLFIIGNCSGLYVNSPNGVRGWLELEKGPISRPEVDVLFHRGTAGLGRGLPLFTVPRSASTVSLSHDGPATIRFVLTTAGHVITSGPLPIQTDRTYRVVVDSHAGSASLIATLNGNVISIGSTRIAKGPLVVHAPPRLSKGVTVTPVGSGVSDDSLCQSLNH